MEFTPEPGEDDRPLVIASDAQRRLYVMGVSYQNDDVCLAIARLLPNGELDSEHYGDGGTRCFGNLAEVGETVLHPTDAFVDADGRLLVAGVGSDSWPIVCRFDASGQLDVASFGSANTPGCTVLDGVTVPDSWPGGSSVFAPPHPVAIAADGPMLRMALMDDDLAIRVARLQSTETSFRSVNPPPAWSSADLAITTFRTSQSRSTAN